MIPISYSLLTGLAVALACSAPSALAAPAPTAAPAAGSNYMTVKEFIYESAPFPSCHASTLAETPAGILAAWFGGTDEGKADVGIWVAGLKDGRWSAPREVATGVVKEHNQRYPCWNPVLFQAPNGPLLLFYKVGPSPSRWWGMLLTSRDRGITWSTPQRLPEGILGPIKNKPVLLADGRLLCPSSTEHDGWRVQVEETRDWGVTWTQTKPLNDGREFGAIQPTILVHSANRLQLLCRSRQARITECWSEDGGTSWGAMKATSLPNPNSGIDAVTLQDGRHVLIYNPVTRGRTPLEAAISRDARSWKTIATLEDQPGEYSYPAVIQAADGMVHVTYTWKRQKIRHVALRLPPG